MKVVVISWVIIIFQFNGNRIISPPSLSFSPVHEPEGILRGRRYWTSRHEQRTAGTNERGAVLGPFSYQLDTCLIRRNTHVARRSSGWHPLWVLLFSFWIILFSGNVPFGFRVLLPCVTNRTMGKNWMRWIYRQPGQALSTSWLLADRSWQLRIVGIGFRDYYISISPRSISFSSSAFLILLLITSESLPLLLFYHWTAVVCRFRFSSSSCVCAWTNGCFL